MAVKEPRYWGSWKGRIIGAITSYGPLTWREIRDYTGLFTESLNKALAEMYRDGTIMKISYDRHIVSRELYREYREFLERKAETKDFIERGSKQKVPDIFSEEKQNSLMRWISQWKELKKLDLSIEHRHFFLEGRHLNEISAELIARSESEVLAVNPYVERCALSDTLRDARRKGARVRLITRPPDNESKNEFHGFLRKDDVSITYNRAVHAKLIVVDRTIAIISSMNFYGGSSGGVLWEAGLVSIEETVVGSVVNSILRLFEKPESIELT